MDPEPTLLTPGRGAAAWCEGVAVLPDLQLVGICTVHRSSEGLIGGSADEIKV